MSIISYIMQIRRAKIIRWDEGIGFEALPRLFIGRKRYK